jgi:hypothetical protein
LSDELNDSKKKTKRWMKLHKESLSQRRGKWGYGEIGRRYGLDCIEPWYGNLLSGNFQIQRNPGIKKGQS